MKAHVALKKYFQRKKKSSPGFSMRALAGRLKISAPFLSRMLNGKKPIPADLFEELARALDVEPELVAGFLDNRPVRKPKEVSTAYSDWELTETQTTQVLRNWYYIPILDLTSLENYDGSAESIAERLGLSLESTKVALRELESLGLLKRENGRYTKVHGKIRFTSSKSTPLIRKFHDDMLEKGQQELRRETSEEAFQRRLITGITLTANPEKIQEAKRKLADFLYELANDLIETPGEEVYHLSAQLFPLSKSKK